MKRKRDKKQIEDVWSVLPVLRCFFSREDLRQLCHTSAHLREKFLPTLVQRRCWPSSSLWSQKGVLPDVLPLIQHVRLDTALLSSNDAVTRIFPEFVVLPQLQSLSLNIPNWSLEPGCLPSTLLNLDLGYSFNKPLSLGVLPPKLRRLKCSVRYNQNILPGSLPPSLTELFLPSSFVRSLDLPDSLRNLTSLDAGGCFDIVHLPKSVETLRMSILRTETTDVFSKVGLRRLYLRGGVMNSGIFSAALLHLPTTLESLHFESANPITTISCCWSARELNLLQLPCLTTLVATDLLIFPPTLTQLVLTRFNRSMPEGFAFLENLKMLQLTSWNFELASLPLHLENLTLSAFSHVLRPGVLPSSLTYLELDSWNRPLQKGILPPSLKALVLPACSFPIPGNVDNIMKKKM